MHDGPSLGPSHDPNEDRKDDAKPAVSGPLPSRGHLCPVAGRCYRNEVFLAFTNECGWTVEQFKAWLFVTLCSELLPADLARSARRGGSPAVMGTHFEDALGALPTRP